MKTIVWNLDFLKSLLASVIALRSYVHFIYMELFNRIKGSIEAKKVLKIIKIFFTFRKNGSIKN